jgi:Ankyrin repeats (many copies)
MRKSNLDWGNSCLFVLADIGDVNLFAYWLDKKKLNIDVQDEDGDTPLHHAVRRGHIEFVIELLKRGVVISSNKKKRTALLDAYTFNQIKIASEITKFVIQRNSIKNIPIQKTTKLDNQEQQRLDQLVSDFIQHLRKNYLVRNIFRFPARHTRRANALIIAARCCSSIKEFKDLLNNQLNLCKGNPANPISEHIFDKRWSKVMENKYHDPNKSLYYKTIYTFVAERFSNNSRNISSVRSTFHR